MAENEQLNRIITGCKHGSNEAFSQLVDVYAKRCYGYFYRLTGNDAESNDLLSRLFLRLVEKIDLFKSGSFEKWLFTIASNIFYDHLRHQYRQKKVLDCKAQQLRTVRPPPKSDSEMTDRLQDGLEKLDTETAELLMLRFYSQLSFKELADLRSEPIGTTLSKVHRGLKKLREIIEKNE